MSKSDNKKYLDTIQAAILKCGKSARLISQAIDKLEYIEHNTDWDTMIICDIEKVQINLAKALGELIEYKHYAELDTLGKTNNETGLESNPADSIDSL